MQPLDDKLNTSRTVGGKRGEFAGLLALLIVVIYVATVRLSLGSESQFNLSKQSSQTWQQPKALERSFPVKIADKQWQFDYTNIESLVLQSRLAHNKNWRVGSDTLSLLEGIDAELPTRISENDLERLHFLLSKNLPKNNAKSLFELVKRYRQFRKLSTDHLISVQQSVRRKEFTKLRNSAVELGDLQQQVFGIEIAEKLFREKNLTMSYLNKRTLIRLDNSINSEVKQEKLSELKAEYLEALENIKSIDD